MRRPQHAIPLKLSALPLALLCLLALVAASGCGGGDAKSLAGPPHARADARAPAPIVQAAIRDAEPGNRLSAEVARQRAEQNERNDRARVPRSGVAPYLPLYRLAARHYEIHWLLLASIHKQETAFSTAEGTYHGLNFANCCAGPMQFNLTNKPVSTWKRFGNAYLIGPPRPERYPHRTSRHPSPYDDWDAIIAAARLLKANGAGPKLDGAAWSAAYLYYGPGDLTTEDYGVTYADHVLARALGWQRTRFCSSCESKAELVAEVHDSYAPALKDAEAERKKKAEKKKAAERRKRARARKRRRERAEGREQARERAQREDRAEGRREKAARERRQAARRRSDRPAAKPDATPDKPAAGQTEQPAGAGGGDQGGGGQSGGGGDPPPQGGQQQPPSQPTPSVPDLVPDTDTTRTTTTSTTPEPPATTPTGP